MINIYFQVKFARYGVQICWVCLKLIQKLYWEFCLDSLRVNTVYCKSNPNLHYKNPPNKQYLFLISNLPFPLYDRLIFLSYVLYVRCTDFMIIFISYSQYVTNCPNQSCQLFLDEEINKKWKGKKLTKPEEVLEWEEGCSHQTSKPAQDPVHEAHSGCQWNCFKGTVSCVGAIYARCWWMSLGLY